jgi:glycosyltransferase involved in cell wall biosynthesis
MDQKPFVTVIVPVWNSPGLIRTCIAALLAQDYPADRRRIVVVDNASTDGTSDAVRAFPEVTLLQEPKPGSYHARNLALDAILKDGPGDTGRGSMPACDYIAFTDADCIPAPDWLSKAVATAERHPGVGVVAGYIDLFRTDAEKGSDKGLIYEFYERLFSFRQDIGAQKGFCATANWLSPAAVFRELGGFDASRKSGADGEMAHKISKSGRPIVYAPDMVVKHPVRGTFQDLAKKRRRLTGGRWNRTRRPGRVPRMLVYTAYDTARRMKTLLTAPQLSTAMRLKLAGLVVALSGVAVAELFRLVVRGEPERA